ncbi:hypothetical protein DMUE_0975 [Dictyocoela muelleri]|nr:hypothetical protein DMUE_0975 [Dictyocoela muelleri]
MIMLFLIQILCTKNFNEEIEKEEIKNEEIKKEEIKKEEIKNNEKNNLEEDYLIMKSKAIDCTNINQTIEETLVDNKCLKENSIISKNHSPLSQLDDLQASSSKSMNYSHEILLPEINPQINNYTDCQLSNNCSLTNNKPDFIHKDNPNSKNSTEELEKDNSYNKDTPIDEGINFENQTIQKNNNLEIEKNMSGQFIFDCFDECLNKEANLSDQSENLSDYSIQYIFQFDGMNQNNDLLEVRGNAEFDEIFDLMLRDSELIMLEDVSEINSYPSDFRTR